MAHTDQFPETIGDATRKGLLQGLGGLAFSILLSVLIVAGLFFSLEPFRTIERAGIDQSFRILSSFPDQNRPAAGSPTYLFIDVDLATCGAFSAEVPTLSKKDYCETHNPITPDFIRAFVRSAAGKPIRSILIDTSVDLSMPEDRALVDDLITDSRRPGAPWVIVPLEVKLFPVELGGVTSEARARTILEQAPTYRALNPEWFTPAWIKEKNLIGSKVRFALFSVSGDTEAHDSFVRAYNPVLKVKTGEGIREIPTVANLAVALGSGRSDVMDCLYFGGACPNREIADQWAAQEPGAESRARRIIYTLPALAGQVQDESTEDIAASLADRYRIWPASSLLNKGRLEYITPQGQDNIIAVVGTSLASGNDRHLTPLGPMSGSEIVINILRTEAEFSRFSPPGEKPSSGKIADSLESFVEKVMSAAFPAALILTAAYILSNIVQLYARKHLKNWGRSRWPGLIVSTILVGTALWLCLQLEFQGAVTALYGKLDDGKVVDTLTPLAAMGIELYTDLAKAVSDSIDEWLERRADNVRDIMRRIGSRLEREGTK